MKSLPENPEFILSIFLPFILIIFIGCFYTYMSKYPLQAMPTSKTVKGYWQYWSMFLLKQTALFRNPIDFLKVSITIFSES